MKLEHLSKTLTLCIEYHLNRGNSVKVEQLKSKLKKANFKRLADVTNHNGLYLYD